MKKLFLLFLCTCISLSFSFGQTSKGTKFWVIDGNLGHHNSGGEKSSNSPNNTTSYGGERGINYNLSVGVSKFFRDNISHGLSLNYYSQNYFSNSYSLLSGYNDNESNDKTLQLNYFIRRFIPIFTHFNFYGAVNAGLSKSWHNKLENNVDSYNYTDDRVSMNLVVGGRYIPKRRFFIDASSSLGSISYNWANYSGGQNIGFIISNNSIFSYFSIGIGKTF
jgi:hypothetical protein